LLAPDAFDFIEGTLTVRPDLVHAVAVKHALPFELMKDLRIFCLNLLRVQDLELWQRLALLGVFSESLGKTLAAGQLDQLHALMDGFTTLLEKGQLLDALDQLQPDYSAQALVFTTLWSGKSFVVSSSASRNQIVDSVSRGLGADPETGQVPSEQLIENYRRGVARLPQALAAAPHLLEHYILNEMFVNFFPFAAEDPYEDFLQLVARFGLLRLMLAAQCNTDGPLPDAATLVRTVQVHCRRFQHAPTFNQRVNDSLTNSGLAKLDKLYSFLRT
jgi:lysine-N-methylase